MRKVTDNKCEDCYYAVPNEQAIGKYNCHRFPDQLLSVPVQAPNGQIVLQITPARPAAERACGEFLSKYPGGLKRVHPEDELQ